MDRDRDDVGENGDTEIEAETKRTTGIGSVTNRYKGAFRNRERGRDRKRQKE